MQAAVHLKGALTMVSASPKSPVEVSAATVDALWIATSRRMLVIFLPFSRLMAAAALEFSTFAIGVLELLVPSCSSRTSGIERSLAPCCSNEMLRSLGLLVAATRQLPFRNVATMSGLNNTTKHREYYV